MKNNSISILTLVMTKFPLQFKHKYDIVFLWSTVIPYVDLALNLIKLNFDICFTTYKDPVLQAQSNILFFFLLCSVISSQLQRRERKHFSKCNLEI